MVEKNISIELLDGVSNYNDWKFTMKMYLTHEDLWSCIEPEMDKDGTEITVDPKKVQKALAKICLHVKKCCYAHIRDSKTAKEAWENLQKAYEDKGLVRRLGLLRILFNIKLSQFQSMEGYVTKIITVAQQIAAISKPIEDEFLAVLMLNGLPSTYEPMVMALESSGVDLTSDLVKGKLLQEDIKSEEENVALATKTKNTFNKRFAWKCFKCHQQGHKASDCNIKTEKQSKGKYRQNNYDKYSKKSDNNNWAMFSALATKTDPFAWYIDSGCTNHMTGRKECLLTTRTDHLEHEVTLANNNKLNCNELQTEDKLEYKFIPNQTQALKFKVKAANDAHIAITQAPNEGNPMYEIFIGGWNNSKIAFRKNREKPDVLVQDMPNTLDGNTFKEFWITWYDGVLALGLGENPTPTLIWTDPEMFPTLFVGIRTGWGATGSWIIEESWNGWRAPPPASFLPSTNAPGWNVPAMPGGSAPTWVPCSGGTVPADAVAGGFDQEQLYVGRASHCGALIPGKVHPSHGVCYVPWGGSEHGIPDYEVLCSCQPTWIPATVDDIPAAALEAGRSEDGEPLYIGRAQYNDTMVIGKVQKSHRVCYISYAGQEIPMEQFDVLVL